MPPVNAPAAVAAPTAKSHNGKHEGWQQQRLDDQTTQFRAFLDAHTQEGLPLPAWSGEIVVSVLLDAAGLAPYLERKSSVFREIAQEYAQRVGLITAEAFREQFRVSVPAVLSPVNEMTYQELLDLDVGALQLTSLKSLAAYRSALTRFMSFVKKTHTDQIGPEWGSQYEQRVQQFIQNQVADKNSRAAKSYLKKYFEVIVGRQRTDGLPASLDAALTQLVKQDGRTPWELSIVIGERRGLVYRLMTGRQKSTSSEALSHLEEELKVEPGTLTRRATLLNPRISANFCPISMFPVEMQGLERYLAQQRTRVKKLLPDDFPSLPAAEKQHLLSDAVQDILNNRHLSTYGNRISKAKKSPYALKPDQMPSRLKKEFDSFCEMKRLRGSMARGKKDLKKIRKPATEKQWRKTMCMFFGWCLLPTDASDPRLKGAGLSPEDLTLGLILLPELITGYMTFRNTRNEGQDTETSTMFLNQCLIMLREGHGWLEGNPEMLERIPAEFQQASETWKEKCAAQFASITQVSDELDIVVGRDPFEPIQALIDMGKPMDQVQAALANNWKELQIKLKSNITDREKAELYRDHVLISMIAAFPLRASHWFGMTYRTDARNLTSKWDGELRHVDGQHWGLYLRADQFKNRRNKTIFGAQGDKPVALLFHESLNSFKDLEGQIDQYMSVYRPLLCPGNGSVFPKKDGTPLTGSGLNQMVNKWTKRYLSEEGDHRYGLRLTGVKPFGPHAFRHLMATHILQTTGNYEDAANMLLDSIEMVKKHYGHLMPEDRLLMTFARLKISQATRTML